MTSSVHDISPLVRKIHTGPCYYRPKHPAEPPFHYLITHIYVCCSMQATNARKPVSGSCLRKTLQILKVHDEPLSQVRPW